jgi:hypothetical protein
VAGHGSCGPSRVEGVAHGLADPSEGAAPPPRPPP